MDKQMFNYLEKRFYEENHPRYHKYFESWVSNITLIQIEYLRKEMYNLLRNGN